MRLATNQFAEYAVDCGNHMRSIYDRVYAVSPFKVLDITDDVYLFDEPNDTRTESSVYILYKHRINNTCCKKKRWCNQRNPINIVSGKDKDGIQIMEIYAVPHSNDVIGYQDLYLQLDTFNVDMIVDESLDRIHQGLIIRVQQVMLTLIITNINNKFL